MAESVDTLTITIAESSGSLHQFRVKRTTPFEKIMNAFYKKLGVSGGFRFVYEGHRVSPEETPKMLEMDDGARVEALVEQTGGGGGH